MCKCWLTTLIITSCSLAASKLSGRNSDRNRFMEVSIMRKPGNKCLDDIGNDRTTRFRHMSLLPQKIDLVTRVTETALAFRRVLFQVSTGLVLTPKTKRNFQRCESPLRQSARTAISAPWTPIVDRDWDRKDYYDQPGIILAPFNSVSIQQ